VSLLQKVRFIFALMCPGQICQ